jgi:hydrogenase maturation factor HypF (carbamoyltransferase family)
MILEYKLDYRSSSLVYEKIFLNQLKEANLNGNIARDGHELKLFVEAQEAKELEEFATNFANALPHSIFLYDTQASMVNEMPSEPYKLPKQEKLPSAPCPKCLNKIQNSYNIFTQCDVCGYHTRGEDRSYQIEFMESAQKIKEGKILEINTFYGKYFVGTPSNICNSLEFDILIYDLATVKNYANIEEYELNALASFEKPAITLKKKLKFTMEYEEVERELIRFRLADDAILYLLMQELHTIGIDAVFITKERVETNETLHLTKIERELKPIEIVASPKHILIINDNQKPKTPIESFYSVIKEHNISEKYENIAGVYLSQEQTNNIIIQGKKYGLIEYLSFDFSFDSISDIFSQIEKSDEQAKALLANYKKKFPELYERVIAIKFDDSRFNIYKFWGAIATVLDFNKSSNLFEGAKILEESAMNFLGDRGVRIDYKLVNKNGKPHFDPLMTIRTAISFKLAGVDQLGLCYGVIESFLEFITNEIDELKQTMGVEAVVITGSLLSNRRVFSKISREVSMNNETYFNKRGRDTAE